jgi:hypothetical protein
VPTEVLDFLAGQLGIADPSCIKQYAARLATQWEHAAEIRQVFGYRSFSEPQAAAELHGFLAARAWTRIEPSKALFDAAAGWLREHRVLLPGVHALAKLVAEVRTAAQERVWAMVSQAAIAADPALPRRLGGLLQVPQDARVSELERLRRGPTRVSGRELVAALDRVTELAGLGAGAVDLSAVPANRLEALARDGLTAKAPVLRRRVDPRRTATLVATVRSLAAAAVDDALDLFGVLMATKLIRVAKRTSRAERLAALPRLARASATLAAAVTVLLETTDAAAGDGDRRSATGGARLDVAGVWTAIEQVAPRERLAAAVHTVEELAPPDADDNGAWRAELVKRFAVVRGFVPLLAEVIPFGAGDPVGWCWTRSGSCRTCWAASGSARARSARSWWWAPGGGWCTATRTCRRAWSTGRRTYCACWRRCGRRCATARFTRWTPPGGATRAPGCWTGRRGSGSARRCCWRSSSPTTSTSTWPSSARCWMGPGGTWPPG